MGLPTFGGGNSFPNTNRGDYKWKVSSTHPGISLAGPNGRESTGTLTRKVGEGKPGPDENFLVRPERTLKLSQKNQKWRK